MTDFSASKLSSGDGQYSPPVMGALSFAQVPTLQNLVDASPSPNATYQGLIFVAGQYAPGDGGGGFFYWNATATVVADGFNVILPTGRTGPGRWVRSTITLEGGSTLLVPFNTNIVAAGNNQASATQLQALINVVTSVPSGTGVQLPIVAVGTQIQIFDRGALPLLVYPPFGQNLEDESTNSPYTIYVGQANTFTYQGGSNWLVEYFEGTSFNVTDFGAIGDGATNNTSAIAVADAAARAAGMRLYFPSGVYMASQLVVYTGSSWYGDGRGNSSTSEVVFSPPVGGTILRQIIGSNTNFIYGNNSAANWGQSTATTFVDGWNLEGLTIDGNYNGGAGNTSGDGVAIFGDKPLMTNVYICNCAGNGLRTGWISNIAPGQPGFGLWGTGGYFTNITIDTVGQHGWWDAGPVYSMGNNISIIDASRSSSNSYDGYFADTSSGTNFLNLHSWTRHASTGGATVFSRYGGNIAGGSHTFTSCQFEGGQTAPIVIGSAGNHFDPSCRFLGALSGTTMLLNGSCSGNLIRGALLDPATGSAATIGINIANSGSVVDNDIEVYCIHQEAGNISFGTADTGGNIIRIKAINAGAATYVASPPASDDFKITGTSSSGEYQTRNGFQQVTLNPTSGVNLLNSVVSNVLTITLTPGTWRLSGTVGFLPASGTIPVILQAGVSAVSGTMPASTSGTFSELASTFSTGTGTQQQVMPTGDAVVTYTVATAIYLLAGAAFSGGTMAAGGQLSAQRIN